MNIRVTQANPATAPEKAPRQGQPKIQGPLRRPGGHSYVSAAD